MKTFLAKAGEIERKHIVFDAENVPVGRLAVKIVNALRGKDCPTYTPHVDTGKFVIVINADKALLTGAKETGKVYVDYVRETNPERLIRDAVWGMLPKGRLARAQYRKLKVYAGAEHPHAAQKPETVK